MERVGKGEVPWSETRGNRSHLLLSGQPSPSTASSSIVVLRVVASHFQNFHLTANKVFDWFVVVLIDDINIVLRKQNLYLLKKKSLDLFDLSVSALFEVTSRSELVRTVLIFSITNDYIIEGRSGLQLVKAFNVGH